MLAFLAVVTLSGCSLLSDYDYTLSDRTHSATFDCPDEQVVFFSGFET